MARRIPEGPPPPPAVQKLRIRYAKRGRLRFSSTRDFGPFYGFTKGCPSSARLVVDEMVGGR